MVTVYKKEDSSNCHFLYMFLSRWISSVCRMRQIKTLQTLHSFDVLTFLTIVQWNTRRWIRFFANTVSKSADGWFYFLVPLVFIGISPQLGWTVFVALIVGFAIERPCYAILKKGFKRNRPPKIIPGFESVITASDEFSFPSGHTSGAFLVVTTLMLLFPVGIFGCYLYGWAASVALSRIILGVHFPLDTVAGALLGSSIAWVAVHLVALS